MLNDNMRTKYRIEGFKEHDYSFYSVQWAMNRVEAVKLALMPLEKVSDYKTFIVTSIK